MIFCIRVNFEICPQYSNYITISQDSQVLYMKTGVRLCVYRVYMTELCIYRCFLTQLCIYREYLPEMWIYRMYLIELWIYRVYKTELWIYRWYQTQLWIYRGYLTEQWIYRWYLSELLVKFKIFREKKFYKIKTNLLCSRFFSECRAACQIMLKKL